MFSFQMHNDKKALLTNEVSWRIEDNTAPWKRCQNLQVLKVLLLLYFRHTLAGPSRGSGNAFTASTTVYIDLLTDCTWIQVAFFICCCLWSTFGMFSAEQHSFQFSEYYFILFQYAAREGRVQDSGRAKRKVNFWKHIPWIESQLLSSSMNEHVDWFA